MMPAAGKALDSALPEFSLVEGGPLYGLIPKGPDRRAAGRPCRVRRRAGSSHVAAPVVPGGAGSRRTRSGPARLIPRQHQHSRPVPGRDPARCFLPKVWIDPRLRHSRPGPGRLRSRERDRDPRAGAGRPPRAPHAGTPWRPESWGSAILALTLVQLGRSPLHAARRRLVLAIDWRRGGGAADVGRVVRMARGEASPRLSVPDLPVDVGAFSRGLCSCGDSPAYACSSCPRTRISAGGLGYLAVAQGHFEILCTVFSAVVASTYAERMMFWAVRLEARTRPLVVTLVVTTLALFLGPLFFFGPRLLACQAPRSARWNGVLATAYVRGFDAKWLLGEGPGGRAPPRKP